MLPKTRKWLEDVRASCGFILDTVTGKTLSDYQTGLQMRYSVERNFEIIGEAVGRIARFDPDTAARIADCRRIISFRNVLVHGYDLVDHETVWEVIHGHLPLLKKQVEELLKEAEKEFPPADGGTP
ncbi:MAG: DUF86 domain-containing protein [bacterium]